VGTGSQQAPEKRTQPKETKPSIITKGDRNYYKRTSQTNSTENCQKEGRPEPTIATSQLSQDKENSRRRATLPAKRTEESARTQ